MTDFLSRTVGDVVSEILMIKNAFCGSFLVLEGDDDIRFWKTRSASRLKCQYVLAGSKPTVIGAILKADAMRQCGVLGIVDDDYDSLLGNVNLSKNIIRTEARDIETLMLSTAAFDKVLSELGDARKIFDLEQRESRNVKDAFISRALIFGKLRYLNALHKWNVAFHKLSPYRFSDDRSWMFDEDGILDQMSKQIPGMCGSLMSDNVANLNVTSPWSILHGKDSISVLAIGLRTVIGNGQHPPERIMQMLRLAFDNVLFQATTLYGQVSHWEAANPPYRILLA